MIFSSSNLIYCINANKLYLKVVNLIRGVRGNTLKLKVERGDHVVPNIQVNKESEKFMKTIKN